MFIGVFNQQQIKALLNLVYRIIMVDGRIEKEEKEFIDLLQICFPHSPEIIDYKIPLKELVKSFEDRESKLYCMINLYMIANIDEEFNIKEKEILEEIIKCFEIDSSIIEKIKNISLNMVNIFKEINEIIGKNV